MEAILGDSTSGSHFCRLGTLVQKFQGPIDLLAPKRGEINSRPGNSNLDFWIQLEFEINPLVLLLYSLVPILKRVKSVECVVCLWQWKSVNLNPEPLTVSFALPNQIRLFCSKFNFGTSRRDPSCGPGRGPWWRQTF